MNKRVLFYSNIQNISDFSTSTFYTTDIKILTDIGCEVKITNKIFNFFSYNDYDIAFIYFFRKGFIPGLIARMLGKRVYFTGGMDYLSQSFASPLQLFVQRVFFILCYLESTKCIIVSQSDMMNIRLFWMPSKKLINVPHVINLENFESDAPKKDTIASICWMGSILNVERKGVDQLLRSFSIFIKRYPTFTLQIIGRLGPGSDYLQHMAAELNITDKVIFHGPVSDSSKTQILSEAKYYCQLSKYEGFGLATLEAMASGCIIIHTGMGGLNEIVQDFGVKVKVFDDPQVIADALINCQYNSGKYSQLVAEGYKSILMRFAYSVRYEAFRKLFCSFC